MVRQLILSTIVLATAGTLGTTQEVRVLIDKPLSVKQLIEKEARIHGIDPLPVLAIAKRESGYDPTAVHCCNYDGTRDWGVMQLNDYVVKHFKIKNPLDAEQNIKVGVGIWASYIKSGRGYDWAQCAYAKGPGRCP